MIETFIQLNKNIQTYRLIKLGEIFNYASNIIFFIICGVLTF